MKKCTGVLFLLIMTAVLLSNPEPGKNSLRIGIHTFPYSLNPVYSTTETSQAIINKAFESLFYFDCKGKITEGLAENAAIKDNGGKMKITIKLKKNIYFPDGKELEPEDVIETVKLLQNPAFQYPYLSDVRRIEKIEKINGRTLKITINGRLASWKNHLTFKILDSREIKNTTPETFRNMRLSGTGPYKIKSIDEPRKIILERSSTNDSMMYRYIEYIVVSYTHLAPLKLVNNELDICELQPESVESYRDIETWKQGFRILKYKKFGYTYMVFNLKNPAITKNLRNIFYNLLIGGNFLDRFLKNKGERVSTPFLLLNSEIKPSRFETILLSKPIRLRILTNTESKLRKEFVLFLKHELKPYNIDLETVFLEYQTFIDSLKTGGYDLAVSGYMLDIDYDMKDIFSSGSYFNYARFQCGAMEALLEKGLRELDPFKRAAIYLEAHNLWLEKLPLLPLFNLYYYVGISRGIAVPPETCSLVGSDGDFLLNIRQWRRK